MKRTSHNSKFWHAITLITFISASLIIVVCLFWLIYPYKVSEVKVPIKILNDNKQIRIGETIEMEIQVNKPSELKPDGSVYITCNDGNLVTMNSMTTNLPVGEYTVVNRLYKLPPKVAVGSKCQFNFRNVYQVNPIRDITRKWASEDFEVIK